MEHEVIVHVLQEMIDLGSNAIDVYVDLEKASAEAARLNAEVVAKYGPHWANTHFVESFEVIE